MLYRFTLSHTSGSDVLMSQPKGWEAIELIARRDDIYIGMFFDFTIKLDFFCSGGGKEFIDNIYDTYGIDADIAILIEIDCDESGVYEELYTGTLDLETYQRTYTQPEFTTVSIIQKGPLQTIKARLDVSVNLTKLETIDGTTLTPFTYGPYEMDLHSKTLLKTGLLNFSPGVDEWGLIGEDEDELSIETDIGGAETRTQANTFCQTIIGDTIIFGEVEGYTEDASSMVRDDNFGGDTQAQSTSTYVLTNTTTEEYVISGKLKVAAQTFIKYDQPDPGQALERTPAFEAFFTPTLYAQIGTTIYLIESKPEVHVVSTFDPPLPTDYTDVGGKQEMTFDFTMAPLNLQSGDFIRFYIHYESTRIFTRPVANPAYTAFPVFQNYINENYDADTKSYISVIQKSNTAATTANVFAIHEAFARIAQSITNSTDAFRSNFFGRLNSEPNAYPENGCGSFSAITNGFQIRQFPLADRPPFVSFKQLFNSCNGIFNLGMGIDQVGDDYFIRVEPKEYFFSTDVLLQIANIKGFKKTIATDYYFNKFQCGYDNWQQDGTQGINGLDEFNTPRTYTVLLKKVGKTLEAKSELVGGAYPLEITRRKPYSNYATTNYQYDDKNFIICLNRSVDGYGVPNNLTTAEKDENYPGTTGILSPETIYNLRISPGRILRRWINWIAPSITKNNAVLKMLKFAYGEGNYAMVSTGTDTCDSAEGTVDESEDVEVLVPNANPAYAPLFIPEIGEFTAPLSLSDYKLIKANPTRCIEISTTDSDFIKSYVLLIKYRPTTGMGVFKALLSADV